MKIKTLIPYLLVLLSNFDICNAQHNHTVPIPDGSWKSVGYARQITIRNNVVSLYDTHGESCTISGTFPLEDFRKYADELTADSIVLRNGITKYYFIRTTVADTQCQQSNTIDTRNPLINFDVLWQTFNENYCSFQLRNTEWESQRNRYRSKLNEKSTDQELFSVLKEMLDDLHDSHVTIDTTAEGTSEVPDTSTLRYEVIDRLCRQYLTNPRTYNKGVITSGLLNSDVAYLQINDLENLADYKINKNLSREKFMKRYERKLEKSEDPAKDMIFGIRKEMTEIIRTIGTSKYCIIDLRFNGGGSDHAALEILSFFTDKKTAAFSKNARFKDGYTDRQNIFISPANGQYNGDIIILTSHQTASAAEVMVMSSIPLKAKRIGSNTEGIFSDMLAKKLPNGWTFSLSNEIYYDAENVNYEKNGIPPDIRINYDTTAEKFYKSLIEHLNNGRDEALESALQLV